ncbi:helix-turn-helix domain-containing protein [Arthrobacter crusticola]|uniref:Helix-turn-helix domain-containing protein n=1 Tax=Arthrobacter crusticola TaxID=2547960 RepID=A0A4R5TV22_9MICC|nr:helix-turn-helix domain-containing protein [Arthrobacter crusticola]
MRKRRLEGVRRALVNPTLARTPIASVAACHGLTGAPHFNRLFRATYGCTPGEYRSSTAGPHGLLRTG